MTTESLSVPVSKENLPYRPCAGVMLVNRQGLVFVGRRNDADVDAWQMPQGGIDPGEAPRVAALRELYEEIGVPSSRAEIVAETEGWIRYDLPDDLIGRVWKGRYRGQEQKWFLTRFLGEDAEIDINTAHPEFDAWRWVPIDEVPRLIVPFKRALYLKVCSVFTPLLADFWA